MFACVEIVETLKQQLAAKDTQLASQATQLTASQQQLAAAQQQNAAKDDAIQLLKNKLFQQSSSASTQPVLPSAQPVPTAQTKAALPPSTPESSSSKGQFSFFCVSKGSGDRQFNVLSSISCNSRGEIVVADYSNHRIQVFDRNGKFLFKFGSNGNGNGRFELTQGVTVDQRNNQIVVADTNNDRIQIFDEKGTFLRVFGSVVRVMVNSIAQVALLLLISREIMSWLIMATIAFRFSTRRGSF